LELALTSVDIEVTGIALTFVSLLISSSTSLSLMANNLTCSFSLGLLIKFCSLIVLYGAVKHLGRKFTLKLIYNPKNKKALLLAEKIQLLWW
jgi:isoprenylcysteine carboxyl methyltransferase (ICMT) family protein YpbQ